MKSSKHIQALTASLVIFFTSSAFSAIRPNVVYGDDNRKDYYQETNALYKELSDSTVGLFENAKLSTPVDNVLKLVTASYKEEYGLCDSEPFASQRMGAFCSGFLVGPDLIATAGHCIDSYTCKTTSFVFGFKMTDEKTDPSNTNTSQVYSCKEVVAHELTRSQDYALIRIDRVVPDHKVLSLMSQNAKVGDELVLIGHPAGIPTKISAGAQVRTVNQGYFVANTDSYGGNSGSAVFNTNGEVAGILVRGEQDFGYDSEKACVKTNYCSDTGCRGEDVTQISYIKEALEKLGIHN